MTNHEKLSKIAAIMNDSDLEVIEKVAWIKTIVNKTNMERYKNPKYTIEQIETQIFNHTGVSIEQMNVKTRKREVVLARQLAHYKCRKFTRKSLAGIAWHFGHKDHATTLHSIKTINNYLEVDKYFHKEHFDFLNT